MNFYSYIYRDPITKTPRYVGKGSGNRAYIHTKNRCDNKQLKGWIKNLKKENLQPFIEIIPALDESHSCLLEVCLIEIFGRIDKGTGPLFNHTDGGEGISGYKHTPESKLKISKAGKGRKCPKTDEHRKKLSIINTGKQLSIETKKKMSNSRLGVKHLWQSNRPRTEKELSNLNKMSEINKLKIIIDGVMYDSVRDGARLIGVHEETVRYRCRSSGFPEYKIIGKEICLA